MKYRFRIVVDTVFPGEYGIEKWDAFIRKWVLWVCPYYSYASRQDAQAQIQRVMEGYQYSISRKSPAQP